MAEPRPCKRCGGRFYPHSGRVRLCPDCRVGRRWHPAGTTFGRRRCDRCGRDSQARAQTQRYCSRRCGSKARQRAEKLLYNNPVHRGTRRALVPAVATGTVRCARGAYCKFAEWVDGEQVGGFIRPGEPWHLGHPDEESAGGPEHRRCNTGAPSRLRARRRAA
jgi:hypothetical protein